jgi:hypothetical protein
MYKKDLVKENEKITKTLSMLNQLEVDRPVEGYKAIYLIIQENDYGFLIEQYDGAEYPIGFLMNLAILQIASIMMEENTDDNSILQKKRMNITRDLATSLFSVDQNENFLDFFRIIDALNTSYREKMRIDPFWYKFFLSEPFTLKSRSVAEFFSDSWKVDEYIKPIEEAFSMDFIVHAICHSLMEIVFSTLEAIAYKGKHINKCELCGKYYVPQSRTDEKYCDFENPDYPGKTCKEAIKLIKIKERTKADETKHLAKRIYNRLYRRQENNPDDTKARRDLFDFTSSNDEWKSNMASGGKTKTEYLHWLRERNKFYTKKKKKVK